MPVIAIGAAIGSLALGGASAIGAIAAGSFTLANTLAAVGAIGATVGAVGAVTGDKGLETAGMVMGGIGGVGALAANAGVLGADATTTSLFGSGDAAADTTGGLAADAADPAEDIDNDIVNSVSNEATSDALTTAPVGTAATDDTSGLINSAVPSDATGGLAANEPDPAEDIDSQPVAAPSSGSPQTTPVAGQPGSSATPSDTTGLTPSQQALAGTPPAQATNTPGAALPNVKLPGQTYTGQNGVTYVSNGNTWTPQMSFWQNMASSPLAQFGVIQAAGSFLSGALSPLTPAQVDQLESQATANKAAAALSTQQLANEQGNVPTATRAQQPQATPVTGTTGVTSSPTGLINMAAPTSATATPGTPTTAALTPQSSGVTGQIAA